MKGKSKSAINMINEQIEALDVITQRANRDGDSETAREKLKRWKLRTVKLLTERVSQAEGRRLEKKEKHVFHMGDWFRNLTEEADMYKGLLVALREEIENHPEDVFSSEPTSPPILTGSPDWPFHPEIASKCKKLFEEENYPEAVEKSFKVVRDKLRELTGYETGSEAFGKGKLKISGASAPHTKKDFNEAVKFLTMAIDRFRNEKAHTADAKIEDPVRAYEYLRLSSLAMNLLDQAASKSKK